MSSVHDSIPESTRVEQLLASLSGVVSAHVVRDDDGDIVEIHILSSPDLHPKQMVRNVESALSAGMGIQIDRRIVSVAQIRSSAADTNGHLSIATSASGDDEAAPGAAPQNGRSPDGDVDEGASHRRAVGRRLEYVRYESHRDDGQCSCKVLLRDGTDEFVGEGSGADTAAGRAGAAAGAVMAAVMMARSDLRLQLDGAVISSSRGRSFVIVAAHAVIQRDTLRLAGAAPLARSPEEGAILAALQATNRWSA